LSRELSSLSDPLSLKRQVISKLKTAERLLCESIREVANLVAPTMQIKEKNRSDTLYQKDPDHAEEKQ